MAFCTAFKKLGKSLSSTINTASFVMKGFERRHLETTQRYFGTSFLNFKYYIKPNYLKRWGRRDKKRRELFAEYESKRGRLRMISKCDILPTGVRKRAASELGELPRDSCITRVRNRCVLTDRGRGIVGRFRISRHEFKYYAEKGLIAGVQRSQW